MFYRVVYIVLNCFEMIDMLVLVAQWTVLQRLEEKNPYKPLASKRRGRILLQHSGALLNHTGRRTI